MAESHASQAQLDSFGRALVAVLESQGKTTAALLDLTTAKTTEGKRSTVARWLHGQVEPSRPKVLAIEATLGLEPGTLSRHLGWLPVGAQELPTVEAAIISDDELTGPQKNILLAALQDFRNN